MAKAACYLYLLLVFLILKHCAFVFDPRLFFLNIVLYTYDVRGLVGMTLQIYAALLNS
jgi:hypothetical protein